MSFTPKTSIVPWGPCKEGNYEVLLRTQGQYRNLEEVRNLVVSTRNGVPVRLHDVGTVEDSHGRSRACQAYNGTPAVQTVLNKQ